MSAKLPAPKEVIEIDINKKYVIRFEDHLSPAEADRIKEVINEWLSGSSPFLVIGGGVELKRIDERKEISDAQLLLRSKEEMKKLS